MGKVAIAAFGAMAIALLVVFAKLSLIQIC
jgi:hypothetical protein